MLIMIVRNHRPSWTYEKLTSSCYTNFDTQTWTPNASHHYTNSDTQTCILTNSLYTNFDTQTCPSILSITRYYPILPDVRYGKEGVGMLSSCYASLCHEKGRTWGVVRHLPISWVSMTNWTWRRERSLLPICPSLRVKLYPVQHQPANERRHTEPNTTVNANESNFNLTSSTLPNGFVNAIVSN